MRNQVFKKLFSVLLALIMVAGLLPASVLAEGEGNADSTPAPTEAVQPTESAEPTTPTETETPEVTEIPEPTPENPAATVEPTQGEPTAEPTDEGIMPANVMPVQANVELQYRIVHLDCGREYFTKDWIIALINEMADAGYNQLQLAFGNGGFRFYLDDMAIGSHSSDDVKNALEAGNVHYNTYGDSENGPTNQEWITYNPSKNALTETEMNAIIEHARSKGIEIVPMLNTPGHMHAVLAAMNQLSIAGDLQVSGKHGCLNLSDSNIEAVAFTKALVEKYVDYFASRGCKFFNFAMDEYSSFDTSFFTYANYLIAYANTNGITPRVFNDALSHGITNNGFIEGTQVCCWDSIQNTGSYSVINTSHDFYYVSTNENWNLYREGYTFVGEYAEATWIEHAKKFDNNVFLYKKVSSKINPVGSMFCIWCNTPGKNTETQIAQQIRMILRVIGARMKNENTYKASNMLVEGGFKADGTINTSGSVSTPPTIKDEHGREGKIDVAIGTSTRIYLPEGIVATWTVTEGKDVVELVAVESDAQKRGEQVVEFADAAPIIGNAVMVKALKTGTATVIATLEDGTVITATVEAKDNTKKHITVVEGKTVEIPIDGNHEGTYDTVNPEIATVTAKYAPTAGGTYYDKAALAAGTFSISNNGNDTNPTTTVTFEDAGNDQYYIKNSSGQYIYPNATNNYSWWSWSYSLGFGKQSVTITSNEKGAIVAKRSVSSGYYNTTAYLTLNNSSFGASGSKATLYIYKRVEQGSDKTTLTFTGHKVGTTTVTIAGVEYTIEVVPMSLENAEKLYIDFWVTNHRIYPTNLTVVTTTSNTKDDARTYREFSAADFYNFGEEGRAITDFIPQTGNYESTTGTEALYWKTRYLPNAHRQTEAGWTNKSGYGTDTITGANGGVDIERIRFYGGKWEYKAVGATGWEALSGTTADETGNQIVAYYMLKTTVTKEVTTYITDWPDKQTDEFYGVAVDYCVKYESDGVRNPSVFGRGQNGNTQWFNCDGTSGGDAYKNGYSVLASNTEVVTDDWKGKRNDTNWYRVINNIRAVETDEYEIYMVTVTPSDEFSTLGNQLCPSSITYDEQYEKVIWAESQDTIATSGLAQHIEAKIGGAPNIDKLVIQQCSGMLVTYYVRAKETADKLTVHYVNNNNNTEFYTYNIVVESTVVFPEIGNHFDNGVLSNYSVQNKEGNTETIKSDLKELPKIAAQYRYSKFSCVAVKRSDDGKDFYLYYTFDNEVTFVVDFGLPIKVTPIDVNTSLEGKAERVEVTQKDVKYGTVAIEENSVNFTYTLNKMINGYDTIVATYYGTGIDGTEGEVSFNIHIIPATNVYYEDSFAKFTGGSGAAKDATWTIVNNNGGTLDEQQQKNSYTNQALEALGTKENVYGYDRAYQNSTMFSMGSARKVTVTSGMVTNWTDASAWPTAQFTFKGTGFDIISLTDNMSGAIFVDVYNTNTGNKEKSVFVDNYYGYTYNSETNTWDATPEKANALYQIPVIALRNLPYAEYNVVIKVAYSEYFDHTAKPQGSYSFWLDAVRVYDPMGKDNAIYNTGNEKEGYPQYIKLRNELAKDAATRTGVVFIDGAANANIALYANYGPNNEVYLAKGQAITFELNVGDGVNIKTIQIAAKAPNGEAYMAVTGDVNHSKAIGTATEMYYELNESARTFTIANTGEGILSLTNAKITYAEKATVELGSIDTKAEENAVQAVRALFAPAPIEPEPEPEPEKTFEPERFEASWSRNVMQGRKATLTVKTSEDVEAITVDGQTIRSYRTRTERMGFGRRAKRITYREFTYSMVAQESADFSVTAINAEGTESEAITARLTVKTRPNSMRDMWDWFKGWF